MAHQLTITPLNYHFGSELHGQIQWDQDSFNQQTSSGIYCKDPDASWFRLKSVDSNPALQPAVYGVLGGDQVTIGFDALRVTGEGTVAIDFIRIASDYSSSLLVSNELPASSLDTYYKNFSIPQLLTLDPDDIGIVISIHPTGDNNEFIVKNVTVTIESANERLSLHSPAVRYEHVGDYLDCIRTYSYTDIDSEYNALQPALSAGHIKFPDDETVAFDAPGTNFKGLMAVGAGSRYRMPVVVYAEYKYTSDVAGMSARVRTYDSLNKPLASDVLEIPYANDWTRGLFVFDGTDFADARKIVADVGTDKEAVAFQLRNVRFSFPRFDDAPKREPNRLEDLFSNLGQRLQGIN